MFDCDKSSHTAACIVERELREAIPTAFGCRTILHQAGQAVYHFHARRLREGTERSGLRASLEMSPESSATEVDLDHVLASLGRDLGEIRDFLGLRPTRVWERLWHPLSKRSRADLHLVIEGMDSLAGDARDDPNARLELTKLCRGLERILAEEKGGLVHQLGWSLHLTLAHESRDRLRQYGQRLRIRADELARSTTGGGANPHLDVVWPLSSEARWKESVHTYGQAVKTTLESKLHDWVGRQTGASSAFGAWLKNDVRAVLQIHAKAPVSSEDPRSQLRQIHKLHRDLIKKTAWWLDVAPPKCRVDSLLSDLARLAKPSIDLGPFVELRGDFPEFSQLERAEKLITLASIGRPQINLVPRVVSTLTDTVALCGLAISERDNKPASSSPFERFWAVVGAVAEEEQKRLGDIGLALKPGLSDLEISRIRQKHSRRICRVLGRMLGADRKPEFVVAIDAKPKDHDALCNNLAALRRELETALRVHFVADMPTEPKSFDFFEAGRRGDVVEGLQTSTGTLLEPPVRNAGPRPHALIDHVEKKLGALLGRQNLAKVRGRSAALVAALEDAQFWYHVRHGQSADSLVSKFVDLINAVDELPSSVSHRSPLAEQWLPRFVRLVNSELGRGREIEVSQLNIEQFEQAEWVWARSDEAHGAILRARRRVGVGDTVIQPSKLVVSRGVGPPPLLEQLQPELARGRDDLRRPDIRDWLAASVLHYIHDGGSWRNFEEDKPVLDYLRVIGAELYPKVGEPFDEESAGLECRVILVFSDVHDEGHVHDVPRGSLRFSDGSLYRFPDGTGPVVQVSKGREPTLFAVLRRCRSPAVQDPSDDVELRRLADEYHPRLPPTALALVRRGVEEISCRLAACPPRQQPADYGPIRDLIDALAQLGAQIVPEVKAEGAYSWQEIRQHAAVLKKDDHELVRPEPEGKEEHLTQTQGEISRLLSVSCVFGGDVVAPLARWIESHGPRPKELRLAEHAGAVLVGSSAYLFLQPNASSVVEGAVTSIRSLAAACVRDEMEARKRAADELVKVLAFLDAASDVVTERASELRSVRDELASFLVDPGFPPFVVLRPPASIDGDAKGRCVRFLVPGPRDGDLVEVLERRVDHGGRVVGQVRVGVSTTKIAARDEAWQLLSELYVALRAAYPGWLSGFDRFFATRDQWVGHQDARELLSVVRAAESMGRSRLERDDSPRLRDAITAVEYHVRRETGLQRMHLSRKQVFPESHDLRYGVELVQIQGWRPGLVVRVVEPAYMDEQLVPKLSGRVLVTR